MNRNAIDFVIMWVDGADPEWKKERDSFKINKGEDDIRDFRFRDWDNLQYIFRGIEKFTPWVRKVHLVTWGHLPKWINTDCEKLNIVNHSDYLPEEYRPCFNSEALEVNLHRIKGLSENFVYFNDDMFILKSMKSTDFFKNDLPCDSAVINCHCCELTDGASLCDFLNIGIINKHFHMKTVLKTNFSKWFNVKYGIKGLRTLYLLPCPRFPGMLMQHLPTSLKKSTFDKLWNLEGDILDMTSKNKFRSLADVNQWIFEEWQLASGEFYPRSPRIGKTLVGMEGLDEACRIVERQSVKLLSYNDADMSYEDFVIARDRFNASLNRIFPEKSTFEK